MHRQGYSDSDQVMARALMTPDELRRMDNDLCIIYEKGIKPVKARKYYYFESHMDRKLSEYRMSHLDFNIENRGKWRKYNPYNPYTEDDVEIVKNDLKVESLDDLFEDNINEKEQNVKTEKIQEESTILQKDNNNNVKEVMSVDIQKELEAKFDELFGPIDEE